MCLIGGFDEPITHGYMSLVMGYLSPNYSQHSEIIKSLFTPPPGKKVSAYGRAFIL